MKLIIQFSPVPATTLVLLSNIFCSTPSSNNLSLCCSLNVKDQVSYPSKHATLQFCMV
jgi:hypothetical protein